MTTGEEKSNCMGDAERHKSTLKRNKIIINNKVFIYLFVHLANIIKFTIVEY